ncbi:MAG: 5'/3'-nucleotidase SurE [Treponema sp.]|nr:5'/3'-nucleotidase SurE [Treponema sp.]
MRILLTNDDSINSPGILMLADALRGAGHRVFVVAPAADQSGVSHSITFLKGPRKLAAAGEDTWSCEGTPVDCVIVALFGGLPEMRASLEDAPPDMVISGINRGANLGTDLAYSGTAAAARQGAICGIPSLALSLHEGASEGEYSEKTAWNWGMAADFAVERLDEMMAYWKPHSFINVNIPNQQKKTLKIVHAFPSFRYYNDNIGIYQAPDGCRYCFANAGRISAKPEQGSDWNVVTEGNASLSEIYLYPVLLESVKREGNCGGKPGQ